MYFGRFLPRVRVRPLQPKDSPANPRVGFQWVHQRNLLRHAALHGLPGSAWCAVRSKTHIYGVPNLNFAAQARLLSGNFLARSSCRILKACLQQKIPCVLENPDSSLLFEFPPLKSLSKRFGASDARFDMCGFGTRWRIRTKIRHWFAEPIQHQAFCQSHSSVCSFSGKHLIILQGHDPVSGRLWSSLAQVYPQPLMQSHRSFLVRRICLP